MQGGVIVKVEFRLDKNCQEPKTIIIADKLTKEITSLMQIISSQSPQGFVGYVGDDVLLLDPTDIVRIYTSSGKVFAVTDEKEYLLHIRLYEAEEKLIEKGFVRISNCEIINIKKAKKFDLSMVGTICVHLSNGNRCFVSRRYVTKIKNTLGLR